MDVMVTNNVGFSNSNFLETLRDSPNKFKALRAKGSYHVGKREGGGGGQNVVGIERLRSGRVK